MKGYTRLLVGMWLVAASATAAPTVSLRASRTSGVAPLAVHFDAIGTTDTGVDGFRDLAYRWNFGDPTSGTFTVTNRSRNEASGPVAAHVFETPGVFAVTVSVTNASGATTQRSTTITVSDPNTVYTGASTTCVSGAGDFTGCPAGAQRLVSSSFGQGIATATPGRRVLFRRGETFKADTTRRCHRDQGRRSSRGRTSLVISLIPDISRGKRADLFHGAVVLPLA